MTEHTPTTEEVFLAYADSRRHWIAYEYIEPQWDRWLAGVERAAVERAAQKLLGDL